jgi:hypothetical protein
MQIVAEHIAPGIKPSRIGPALDFDTLLLALMTDFLAGQCPTDCLLRPRRVTDGLPDITKHTGAYCSLNKVISMECLHVGS